MTHDEIFEKNLTLSTEFSLYLLEHPEFADTLPDKAHVVLLPKDDPELCKANLGAASLYGQRDGDDRPLVYVEIERLAPIRSRLVNPRVATQAEVEVIAA
jgi:hypothetical protein